MNFQQASHLHLWFRSLAENDYQAHQVELLNAEEMQRANKFKFELHRQHFINSRATLRSILSLYLNVSPQRIQFLYSEKGKPFIEQAGLQFNLSHSHDLALYAISQQMEVGIDIEKIRPQYNDDVAQRFFSPEEYQEFSLLSPEEKRSDFYRIWSGKEALVKAIGKGIGFSLSSFTIPREPQIKEICLNTNASTQTWYLENLDLFPGYQASFATNQKVQQLSFFEWTNQGQKKWREDELRSNP